MRYAIALAAALVAGCASAPLERFPSRPGEYIQGSSSELRVPSATGPFPAVVLLHTCAGIKPHLDPWAYKLVQEGYVVMKVDSFGPRGEGDVCNRWTVSVDQQAADALAAAEHLRNLPFVDRNRVAAVGFSYGAMAALRLSSAGYVKRQKNTTPFRALVSFYPSCYSSSPNPVFAELGNNIYRDIATPVHVFLGGADAETPSAPCVDQAENRKRAGQPVSYTVFDGATHGFDMSFPSKGYRYDADAVERSWNEMREFLARNLK